MSIYWMHRACKCSLRTLYSISLICNLNLPHGAQRRRLHA